MNFYILNSYTDKSVAYDIKTGCTNCVPNRYNELKFRALLTYEILTKIVDSFYT